MTQQQLLAQLQQWQQRAAQHHIRLPVVWQGDKDSLLAQIATLLQLTQPEQVYWLGADAPPAATDLSAKTAYQLLGTECDTLVINAFNGFNADLVAASAGCVKAGGLWLLLCPPFELWQHQPNPAHKHLLPYPLDASTHQGQFVSSWLTLLQQQNIFLLRDQQLLRHLSWPELPTWEKPEQPYITTEQQQAVTAIHRVVSGHRRRPLVLTANRGRGKSAALGIAAAQLAEAGKHTLLTAPSPNAAQTAQRYFQQLTPPEKRHLLQFMPFDALLRSDIKADLLLVDEAAAIPTPVLQQLLHRFSRIVFASTEHGYEGTGRGFQLRFQQYLNEHSPNWRKLHMQQPVRYQANDPLEQTIFNCFLLQLSASHSEYNRQKPTQFQCFTYTDWINQPALLQQVFSLLSLAHYQTQVKDLAAVLDNPQLTVVTLQQNNNLLACALVSKEGEIPAQLAAQIYRSERRLQGHLLAQNLAFHLARPELAEQRLWRVMRIAVQPGLQRSGLGMQLLLRIRQLAQQQEVFCLGTSYGLTAELLEFWHRAGYQPVRLGSSTDKASSEYSLLMLQAVKSDKQHVDFMQQQFAALLYQNLQTYPLLDTELAISLAEPDNLTALTAAEIDQLRLFSLGQRPYELVQHLLLRWFNLHKAGLPLNQQVLFAALLWQRYPIADITIKQGFDGKSALMQHLAEILRNSDSFLPHC
ncbi:tRNA(Met) cytidine acetyltransferase TmcA [Rheinheimera aquimaris]|uniref:tRNA(Met) cytidine acetyltransferase TmcA n=1 Tax=Rheinheimera aquimaris TaxID=412437 RepID=UPI001E63A25C|nr:GNAT family N-acetyltransferase [Rheinheimera aquimaris]MCD1599537.1 GNAT family N-acetyltransferase [Rheinheimera aquimaris]